MDDIHLGPVQDVMGYSFFFRNEGCFEGYIKMGIFAKIIISQVETSAENSFSREF